MSCIAVITLPLHKVPASSVVQLTVPAQHRILSKHLTEPQLSDINLQTNGGLSYMEGICTGLVYIHRDGVMIYVASKTLDAVL